MINYHMDITQEELDIIVKGLGDDGSISKDAEKVLLAKIEEGKSKEYPIFEVKRQIRQTLNGEQGYKVSKAVSKLW